VNISPQDLGLNFAGVVPVNELFRMDFNFIIFKKQRCTILKEHEHANDIYLIYYHNFPCSALYELHICNFSAQAHSMLHTLIGSAAFTF